MERVTRAQFLARLQNEWATFVPRFQRLTPAEQSAFLARQGYPTFTALLSHVIAWWQDAARTIPSLRADPGLPLASYDVDAFNARAVQQFSGRSEAAMIQTFEAQRQTMQRLVSELSDGELGQGNVNTRLFYEIISHWKEHEL